MAKTDSTNSRRTPLVPEPTLRRMPCYLSYLKLAKKAGSVNISSTQIARDMGVDPTQVTKDLSHTCIVGKTRVGYEIDPLIRELEDFLCFNTTDEGYLFGAGSLGTALLLDHGLCQFGFKIAAAFDINPDLAGMNYGGTTIYHIDDFAKVKKDSVKIGVLTVPVESSQEVANLMIENGIKAIWNFTPVRIKTPPDIVVQNTSIYAHLAVIFNRLHSK